MKYISNYNISLKRVILRCDLNVPIKDGKIIDDTKIIKSLNTINYLLKNDNKVIILSHFGRVKEEEDKKDNSLMPIYNYLKNIIDVDFAEDPLNIDRVVNESSKKCILVENTRFADINEKKESSNDLELAKYWSSFGDVFVNDAFASLHRVHASTAGISKYLPTYFGFLVEEEISNLSPLLNVTSDNFIVIMGGAKIDDKIPIIESLITKCNKIILTGGILNSFLKASGKNVGNSLSSKNDEVLKKAKYIIDNYKEKIYFTDLFVVNRKDELLTITIDEVKEDDIIYDNIPNIKELIDNKKTVFLNGTCGKYEDKLYQKGTNLLFKELVESNSSVFVGGGDTESAVKLLGYRNSFKFISSGGGATLEYVANGSLKSIEWINNNEVNTQ